MKYAIIKPSERKIEVEDFDHYRDALKAAGLDGIGLDFGTVARWPDESTLNIMVYEFGLLEPKDPTYFIFNKQLFNGNAVVYKADAEGETVDFNPNLVKHLESECPDFLWLESAQEAESAIAAGRARRPQSSINGVVTWEWKGSEK